MIANNNSNNDNLSTSALGAQDEDANTIELIASMVTTTQ